MISHHKFKSIFDNAALSAPDSILKTYSGEIIEQVGSKNVTVDYNGQTKNLKIRVVKNDGPSLFGWDWLQHIKFDWNNMFNHDVQRDDVNSKLQSFLDKYKDVFSDGIGKVKGLKAKLILTADAKPKFVNTRNMSFSLKPKIEQKVNSLE